MAATVVPLEYAWHLRELAASRAVLLHLKMSSSTTPPQVKPGPSLMTLVEASSRRRTDTSDATVRTRSATISVGHGASNLSERVAS